VWNSKSKARYIHVSLYWLILTGALMGCSRDAAGPADYSVLDDGTATYFLTLPVVPNAVMEALYQGRVLKDERGCLRLQQPDDATVVWPFGFTLEVRKGQEWVLDATGKDVGKISGTFRFGGGEVPFLHEGLGFTAAANAQIQAKCPGRFWIVAEIP
jgi:hypothetical protein